MPLRSKACALGLLVAIFTSPAWAQSENTAPNPTAQSIPEQQLLKERRRIEGPVTIPDRNAGILEQPQGRQYQAFHERVLPQLAGAAIILTLVALAAFYARRGPITLDRPLRGVKITRFSAFERFTHWLTASSFIVLAVTGLLRLRQALAHAADWRRRIFGMDAMGQIRTRRGRLHREWQRGQFLRPDIPSSWAPPFSRASRPAQSPSKNLAGRSMQRRSEGPLA